MSEARLGSNLKTIRTAALPDVAPLPSAAHRRRVARAAAAATR